MFQVFPSKGYKNSGYKLRNTLSKGKITVTLNEVEVKTAMCAINEVLDLGDFNQPGCYNVSLADSAVKVACQFEVIDSLRFGSSKLDKSYIFDHIPFTLLVYKDRLMLYDETLKALLEESFYSPTRIELIDTSYLLFITDLVTGSKPVTNLGVFSIDQLSLQHEWLNDYGLICYSAVNGRLWLYNYLKKEIQVYSLRNLSSINIEVSYPCEDFVYDAIIYLIYYTKDKSGTIRIINCQSLKEETIDDNNVFINPINGHAFTTQDSKIVFWSLTAPEYKQEVIAPEYITFSGRQVYNHDGIVRIDNLPNKETIIKNPHFTDNESKFLLVDRQLHAGQTISIDYESQQEWLFETRIKHELFIGSKYLFIHETLTDTYVYQYFCSKSQNNQLELNKRIKDIISHVLRVADQNSIDILSNDVKNFSFRQKINNYALIEYNDQFYLFLNKLLIYSWEEEGFDINLMRFGENIYLFIFENDNSLTLHEVVGKNLTIHLSAKQVFSKSSIEKSGRIYYKGTRKTTVQSSYELHAFDLIYKQINLLEDLNGLDSYQNASDFQYRDECFYGRNGILIKLADSSIKASVPGDLHLVTPTLNKVLSKRSDLIYISNFNNISRCYETVEVLVEEKVYREAHMSPDGKILLLKNSNNNYTLVETATNSCRQFQSGKFLRFMPDGKIMTTNLTGSNTNTLLYDPLTLKSIASTQTHNYKFVSPDGKLYADSVKHIVYKNKLTHQEMGISEYKQIELKCLILSSDSDLAKKGKLENRRLYFGHYFSKYPDQLKRLGIKSIDHLIPSSLFEQEMYIAIGAVGTGTLSRLYIPNSTAYINYIAFSYDGKCVGIVGKLNLYNGGLIQLNEIDYNDKDNSLNIGKCIVYHGDTMADWICGFSANGYFATRDSRPRTVLINLNDEYKRQDINSKSFICFSPSGKYMALNQDSYSPMSLGGCGHQRSGALHILRTTDLRIVDSYNGHGETLINSQSIDSGFVAFANDEKSIMSLSKDGVAVVRSVDLDKTN